VRFTENRRIAVIGMAVLILLSLPLGVARALLPMRANAQEAYWSGETGIARDLELRLTAAYNLTTVASRWLDAGSPEIQAVLDARSAMTGTDSIREKYRANVALTDAVTDLCAALDACDLSEQDAKYRRSIDADLRSCNEIIGHSDYNRLAAEYNDALSAFPASALGHLIGLRPLELFA